MVRPRKTFGPLLYGTLVVAALLLLGEGVRRLWPVVQESWVLRSLAGQMRDTNETVREKAARQLAGKAPPAVPFLLAALHDPHGEVRVLACRTLARMSASLEDTIPAFAAARALLLGGETPNPAAVRALLALVSEPYPRPDRGAILNTLKETGAGAEAAAVDGIVALLAHSDTSVRLDAIDALRQTGPRA